VSRTLRNRAAIVGIGQTEFSKASGRSELQLACEATRAALDDAGIHPRDVDGLVTFTMDSSEEIEVARNLGIPTLTMFSRVAFGGGAACAVVMQAAMAVATGVADVVVCYRAFNERSGMRYGGPGMESARLPPFLDMYGPYGLLTPASWVALHARRYMHEYGVTNEDFGRISVVDRKHAANNPAAWFYQRPITLADHQNSRWIVEPVLRLLDCCQESDGGVAIVVTSLERARHLKQKPVRIVGACQSIPYNVEVISNYYHADLSMMPEAEGTAKRLYAQTGMKPSDMQMAMIYDAFTPQVLKQIEAFGFCKRGEGKDFVKDGHIGRGGSLPVNTNGGLIGEAYIHGMNNVAEAVRQVRGTSVNQVDKVHNVLVSSGMAGAVLAKD